MEGVPFVPLSASILKLRRERLGLLLLYGLILLIVLVSELVADSMQIEVEKEVTLRFTFSAVETDVDLHNEFLVMGISSGVLEMGTDVLLEIETMAYVFQETGSVVCDFQEMGTVACAFLEKATEACAFLEMGSVACAFPEMGILAYALLEMEIDVYLVKTCVG